MPRAPAPTVRRSARVSSELAEKILLDSCWISIICGYLWISVDYVKIICICLQMFDICYLWLTCRLSIFLRIIFTDMGSKRFLSYRFLHYLMML